MDKPLHVQVAEALGCKPRIEGGRFVMRYFCTCPAADHAQRHDDEDWPEVLGYDTDWSATGPLIQRLAGNGMSVFHLWVYGAERRQLGGYGDGAACVYVVDTAGQSYGKESWGDTPLVAVCKLIVSLAREGKLPK